MSNEEQKKIFIKDLATNKEYEFDVDCSMKIYELKEKIEKKIGRVMKSSLIIEHKNKRNPSSLNDENLTLKEAHFRNGDSIIIGKTEVTGGGGGIMSFTDVSKGNTINLDFSPSAPTYRTPTKGINIFGICKCKFCKANGQEVVVPVKEKKINLVEEKFNQKCPECDSVIEPKTVGFYLCKYHIYGEKIEDKKLVPFDNGYQEANDYENLQYYADFSNGDAKFTELIFEIIEYY